MIIDSLGFIPSSSLPALADISILERYKHISGVKIEKVLSLNVRKERTEEINSVRIRKNLEIVIVGLTHVEMFIM